MSVANRRRRLPAGVELLDGSVAHARVWAPARHTVELVLEQPDLEDMFVQLTGEGFDVDE